MNLMIATHDLKHWANPMSAGIAGTESMRAEQTRERVSDVSSVTDTVYPDPVVFIVVSEDVAL